MYVPLLSTVEFTHNHEYSVLSPKNHGAAAIAGQRSALHGNHSDVCFACLYAAGHFINAPFALPCLSFQHGPVPAAATIPIFEFINTTSARSPPPAFAS